MKNKTSGCLIPYLVERQEFFISVSDGGMGESLRILDEIFDKLKRLRKKYETNGLKIEDPVLLNMDYLKDGFVSYEVLILYEESETETMKKAMNDLQ